MSSHSVIGDVLKNKHTMCILVVLIGVVLFLIYMSRGSTIVDDFCGCGYQEGIQYAKRVPPKEGLKSTYSVESPALKAMFEKQGKEQFNVMKTKTVAKAIPTKAHEKFSNDFVPPQVMRATGGATAQSPFFGPINL